MIVLVIDTSQLEALVALVRGGQVLSERRWQSSPRMGHDLLVAVQEVLTECKLSMSDIERIAVAVRAGVPGRTAALRAATTVANILGYGRGIPIVAVTGDELMAMAEEALSSPVTDFVAPKY